MAPLGDREDSYFRPDAGVRKAQMQVELIEENMPECWTGGGFPLFSDSLSSCDEGDEEQTDLHQLLPALGPDGMLEIDCMEHHLVTALLFRDRYRMKKPIIMRNMAGVWPAVTRWSGSASLSDLLSTEEGTTLVSKDNLNFLFHELCDVSSVLVQDAVKGIMAGDESESGSKHYTRLYIDKHPELLPDIDVTTLSDLASTSIGSVLGTAIPFVPKNMGVWVSSAGCVTPLHYDLCHGFLCQIVGRKQFLLSSPEDTLYLYQNNSIETKNQTSSKVDLNKWLSKDAEQRKQYPNVDEAQLFRADLQPGDVLYTPPGWWHSVTSIDISVSVLLPFDMTEGEHLSVLQSL